MAFISRSRLRSMELIHTSSSYSRIDYDEDLILSLLKTRKEELIPIFTPTKGVIYKIDVIEISLEDIDSLYRRGLLEKVGVKTFIGCPVCGSTSLITSIVCPSCREQTIVKKEFLIHYECNYVGEVELFREEKGVFICPNCKKEMKRVGIDYGRPGKLFRCLKCKEIFQYPLIQVLCDKNHLFKLDDADFREFPIYKISVTSEATILNEILEEVKKFYEYINDEIEIKTFNNFDLGKEIYTPPITVIHKIKNKTIVVDFILNENAFENKIMKILKLSLKGNVEIILFTNIKNEGINLFNPKKIDIIKLNKIDLNEIIPRLFSSIFSRIV